MRLSPLSQLEVKLVPLDTDGLATLDRIWLCTRLGELPVADRRESTLWDRYYDTPTYALWLRHGYLRLRAEEAPDGRDLITYRRARVAKDDAMSPFEIVEVTMPFSDLRLVTEVLVHDTGDLSQPRPGAMGPPEVFGSMGLEEILSLRTRRRRMRIEVLPRKHVNLKLDVTQFEPDSEPYVELEVEISDPQDIKDLSQHVLRGVLEQFGAEKWEASYTSKLEAGLRRLESRNRDYPSLGA